MTFGSMFMIKILRICQYGCENFNCCMFCCTLLYVISSFAITWMGKRELVALLGLSSWCLVMVVWLILAVPCFFSAVCDCGIS